ncbi:hypothetical protein [Caballeronia sp. KNU42]
MIAYNSNTLSIQPLCAWRKSFAGVGPITDALLSQNQLIAAQNAYADSYSAALSAAASLALATGEIGTIAPDGDPVW